MLPEGLELTADHSLSLHCFSHGDLWSSKPLDWGPLWGHQLQGPAHQHHQLVFLDLSHLYWSLVLCLRDRGSVTDGRPFGFEGNEFYFKTEKEMRELFGNYKDAIENSGRIADKCNFDFEFDVLHLPDFKADDGLSHKCSYPCCHI